MDESMALCWQNLSLYATVTKKYFFKKKKIQRIKLLHNVSGIVKSGNLTAILGPSGAGKTTLLAAISQRYSGYIQGEIHINGRPVDKDLMIKMCGFVPQQDLAIKSLTVIEHLHFMASLKMDRRVSVVQQNRIITSIIQDLGLDYCSLTQLSALSGGERRRVSLAVQILTDPPILICDEPTSGLDSYTACTVITLLRQMASKGKAVICSVHQPASGIFEMFDTVSLLVPGGKLAYFGEVAGAKKYFSEMGLCCPPSYNTAEFVVKQLNTIPDKLSERFAKTEELSKLNKEIDSVKRSTLNHQLIYGMDEKFLKFYSVQTPTLKTQLMWLTWRSTIDLFRNSQRILLRFALYIITALLIACPYVGIKLNQEGIQNIQGLNYSVVTETIFTQAYAVIHTFPGEIPVLLREIGNGVYQPAPYYLSKIIVLLPRVITESIIFSAVIYLVTEVEGRNGFFWFVLPVIACGIASSAYGCCISAMFENVGTASLLAVPFDFVSYTFSGLFLQLSSVPFYLSWIKYISRFYYGLEAVSILHWKDVKDIPCPENPDLPCISNGGSVLTTYGYQPNNLIFDFSSLFIIFVIMHVTGYIFLLKRSKKQSIY